jgi:hypothetical protein
MSRSSMQQASNRHARAQQLEAGPDRFLGLLCEVLHTESLLHPKYFREVADGERAWRGYASQGE